MLLPDNGEQTLLMSLTLTTLVMDCTMTCHQAAQYLANIVDILPQVYFWQLNMWWWCQAMDIGQTTNIQDVDIITQHSLVFSSLIDLTS